jgi:hypothetical protein
MTTKLADVSFWQNKLPNPHNPGIKNLSTIVTTIYARVVG